MVPGPLFFLPLLLPSTTIITTTGWGGKERKTPCEYGTVPTQPDSGKKERGEISPPFHPGSPATATAAAAAAAGQRGKGREKSGRENERPPQ